MGSGFPLSPASPSVSSHGPEELSTLTRKGTPPQLPLTLVSPAPPRSCAYHKPDSISRLSQGWGSRFESLQVSKTRSRIFKHEKDLRDKETAIHFLPFNKGLYCLFSASLQNKVETKAARGHGRPNSLLKLQDFISLLWTGRRMRE